MYSVPKLKGYTAAELDAAVGELLAALDAEASALRSEAEWKTFRDRWMARKTGILTQVNDLWLKAASAKAKRDVGQRVNELKARVERGVESARQRVHGGDLKSRLESERLDVTLPGIRRPIGAEHPVLRVNDELLAIFRSMGYSIADGPEVETDFYNFEALNFPPEHPARDTQDTLFLAGQENKPLRDRLLLRTHTSPVQIRTMQQHPPPVRVVCPGKVYRNDAPDATHSPVFHQIEGLAVDFNITFGDLKGTLDYAMKAMFGASVKTRFQPSFFPFTEPSAEVAISCIFCGGKGYYVSGGPCRHCKQSGWIELLGCGMVDPAVYEFVCEQGYDPAKVSGFAWGLGVERIAIMKYGVEDIQYFFHGDVRFLEQFG